MCPLKASEIMTKASPVVIPYFQRTQQIWTSKIYMDDFGLHPMDKITRLALLQILEDWYGKKSTLISSQLPVDKWHTYIGESTVADAIMDRLAGNAHRFDLKGDSLRKKKTE